jgi:hypothetical protein
LNRFQDRFDQERIYSLGVIFMSDTPYRIDLGSILRAFPPGKDAPSLLLDFAAWLEGRTWGSVGCFSLVGQFSDLAPIFDGSPLRRDFALFLRLPEGSVVGAWYGGATDVVNPPIVVIGSEGQNEILGPSLEGLLAKIALGWFEENEEWTDFAPYEDLEEHALDELAYWLSSRLGGADLEELTATPSGLPDFTRWTETWCRDREKFWAEHPVSNELGRHLAGYLPKGKNPWDKTIFNVAIVGQQYQVQVLRRGPQPVEEAAIVEPILRGLRDEMWQAKPELGLWHSMSFGLYADGHVLPYGFDYETRPTIGNKPADVTQARADLARAPRPQRWVPSWLAVS